MASTPSLTVHHLHISQSERIVWLCEELGIPYSLKLYNRQESNKLAPPEYRSIHWTGTAPVIEDKSDSGEKIVLAESGAIIEYILNNPKYNKEKRLMVPSAGSTKEYLSYIFWLHHANAGFMSTSMMLMMANFAQLPDESFIVEVSRTRFFKDLEGMNDQLSRTNYLACDELTAADIMIFFSLTTLRAFVPFDPRPYPHIIAYLERVGKRDAYRRAMEKAEPGFTPMLAPKE